MRVSSKELFNLISKNDTNELKASAEKLVDTKTPDTQSTKQTNVKELIESLFKDLSNSTKTKENVLTNLKQSDVAKQMQNTTKELTSLLDLVKADKTLFKFAPTLEKLLANVKDINPENIKSELLKSGVFMESKLASESKEAMPAPLKEILTNLKETISKNTSKESLHVKMIDTLLNAKKADKSFLENLTNLVKSIKNSQDVPKQAEQSLAKLETIIKQNTSLKQSNVKEVLANLKEAIVKDAPKESLHVKTLDKLLETPKANKEFLQDIKTLLSDLKNTKNINKPAVEITAKLESLVQKSSLVESKIQNNPQITPKEIEKVTTQIKEVMGQLKELVSKENIKNAPALLEKSQTITNMVEQTLKMPEFFPQGLSKATLSEQLQQVVNILKSELVKTDAKNSLHVEVSKLTGKLESVIKEQIATKNIVPNQKFTVETPIKSELLNDVKATLLSIKHELSSVAASSTYKEVFAQVDRLLTHIDYFQLVSLSSNASTTYLPFSWDSLEGGQISLKKLKENRFFCEINLKLKEYGTIDLMVMLFEDINVNISVFAEKEEFTQLVQENLSDLKQGINKLGLIPSNIQLFDALKDKKLKEDTRNFASSTQLGSGLNIEV